MIKWMQKNKVLLFFILHTVITFVLLFYHENYRDEAQAWLIAKNCNLTELFGVMKYEGHFMLWYLILMPFAKLGFPYFTMNIISCIINNIYQ